MKSNVIDFQAYRMKIAMEEIRTIIEEESAVNELYLDAEQYLIDMYNKWESDDGEE